MARGRKRLIAGWGLVGLGVVVAVAIAVSSRYTIGKVWTDDPQTLRTIFYVTLSRGYVHTIVSHEDPGPTPWASQDRKILFEVLKAMGASQTESSTSLQWWLPGGWRIVDLRNSSVGSHTLVNLIAVLWPLALLTLAGGSFLIFLGRRAGMRSRVGACVRCGYDLKGLEKAAACPECGKAAAVR